MKEIKSEKIMADCVGCDLTLSVLDFNVEERHFDCPRCGSNKVRKPELVTRIQPKGQIFKWSEVYAPERQC